MLEGNQKYTGLDLAIIVPTKDRPDKVRNLLESLTKQTEKFGRLIIIDGGESVKDVVGSFAGRIPVEHYLCHPPGQIRQRNMGISLLSERTPLVAFVDDDIVFEKDAFAEMIACWNSNEKQTAGIAFNIVNFPPYTPSSIRRFFLIDAKEPGKVMKSGMPTPIVNVSRNIGSQWLPGGATVWRQNIIKKYKHQEIYAKRAMCEDLIFSYPIGRQYPLFVAHRAYCQHEHVYDHTTASKAHFYYGRTYMLWMLHFVSQNKDLSVLAYLWMGFGMISGDLLQGVLKGRRARLQKACGEISGIFTGLKYLLIKGDLVEGLKEKVVSS